MKNPTCASSMGLYAGINVRTSPVSTSARPTFTGWKRTTSGWPMKVAWNAAPAGSAAPISTSSGGFPGEDTASAISSGKGRIALSAWRIEQIHFVLSSLPFALGPMRFALFLGAGLIHQLDEVLDLHGGTPLAQLIPQLQHTSGAARDHHRGFTGFDGFHLALADLFGKIIIVEAERAPTPAAALRVAHLHQLNSGETLHDRPGLQRNILTADEMTGVVVGYFQ